MTGAKDAREEMGPDFDVDWKKLDPRQYDPRRIIREALTDVDPFDPEKPVVARAAVNENPPTCSTSASGRRWRRRTGPFDSRRPEAERSSSRGRAGRVSDAGSPGAPARAAGTARPSRRSPCRCAAGDEPGRRRHGDGIDEPQQALGSVAPTEARGLHSAHRGVDRPEGAAVALVDVDAAASSASATRRPRRRERVSTDAFSPYSLAFAARMASSPSTR